MPGDLFTSGEFAKGLRVAFPAFESEPDDDRLVDAYLKVRPELAQHVIRGTDLAGVGIGSPQLASSPGALPKPPDPESLRDPDTFYGKQSVDEYMQAGPKRVAKGVRGVGRQLMDVTLGNHAPPASVEAALQPYADVAGGVMATGGPAVLPALALSPEVTLPALAVGTALSAGTKWLTEKLGAPPSAVELLSTLSMVVGGGMTGSRVHEWMGGRDAAALGAAEAAATRKQGIASAAAAQAEGRLSQDLRTEGVRAAGERAAGRMDQQAGAFGDAYQARTHAVMADALEATATQRAMDLAYVQAREHPPGAFDYIDSVNRQVGEFRRAHAQTQQVLRRQLPGVVGRTVDLGEAPPNVEVIGRAGGAPVRGSDVLEDFPPGVVDMASGEITRPRMLATASSRDSLEPPPVIETIGDRQPVVAHAPFENRPEPLVTKMGDQLEEGLGGGKATGKPRIAPASEQRIRGKLRELDTYKAAYRAEVESAAGQMADQPHEMARLGKDREGVEYYKPATAGADVYWRILDAHPEPKKPARAYIQGLLETLRDTGAKEGKELPSVTDKDPAKAQVMQGLMDALGVSTEAGARRAYDSWYAPMHKVLDRYARRRLAADERWAAEQAESARSVEETGVGQPQWETSQGPAGAPPSVGMADDMPEFLNELSAERVSGGWEPGEEGAPPDMLGGEPTLPGVEPQVNELAPVADLPPPSLQLTPVESAPAVQQSLLERAAGVKPAGKSKAAAAAAAEGREPSFFDLIKGEEGMITLNVRPGNARGLKDWLARHEEKLGDEGWFQAAQEAMDEGNPKAAYRAALGGVSQMNTAELGAGAAAVGKKDRPVAAGTGAERGAVPSGLSSVLPGRSPAGVSRETTRAQTTAGESGKAPRAPQSTAPIGIPVEKIMAAAEEHLGDTLPKGTTVGEGGVLKMPGNPGGLDPKFTDMALARSVVTDIMKEIDATAIVRVEGEDGKLDQAFVAAHPEMRITAQMADQIVSAMPDFVLDSYKDLTGLDAAQLGQHFQRAFSQAGKLLHAAKVWQDENWDSILHLDPLTGSTRGPGAAGRLEFLGPERAKLITDYLQGGRDELSADEATGVLKDIGTLSAKQLKEIGFRLPENAKVEGDAAATKAARTYVSNWLRQQRQLVEASKRVEAIVAEGHVDRAIASAALGVPTKGGARDTGYALMRSQLSFLISQASTALHVFESQTAQYGLGIFEEVLNAGVATMRGDPDSAAAYMKLAKNYTKSATAKGSVPLGALKHPTMDGVRTLFEYAGDILQTAKPGDVRMALKQLEEFPDLEQHLLGTMMAHEPMSGTKPHVPKNPVAKFLTSSKLGNFLTAGMRVSEGQNRSMTYDAMLRTAIELKGHDPEFVLRNGGDITPTERYGETEWRAMQGAAVARAIYGSQASAPYPGTVPKALIDFLGDWSKPAVAGPASLVVPFPKYAFGGGPRWLWDRMPGALVADIARWKLPLPLTGGKPRIQLGMERLALEKDLPKMHYELGRAQYDSATATGESVKAWAESRELLKEHKQLERELARATPGQGELYGETKAKYDALVAKTREIHTAVEGARAAKERHTTAEQRITAQQAIIKESTKKVAGLQEIAAPNWDQAISRQAQGAMLLTAAIALRAAQPADSKWSEVEIPHGLPGGGARVDMKWTGPFAAYMLMGDVIHDVHKHTDWPSMGKAWDEAKGESGIRRAAAAMKASYTGKYTAGPLLRDATEAFFSLNGALGGTSAVIDTFLGKDTTSDVIADFPDLVLGMLGQVMGRFAFPLRQFSDLGGLVSEGERQQHLSEEPGKFSNPLKELVQPTLENIPGARQLIKPKVDPFTGGAKESPMAAMKPLTGMNPQIAAPLQKELNRTGLAYAKVAPHVSGDRDFDNEVAGQYATLMRELLPGVIQEATYKKMPPQLQRDRLAAFAGVVRRGAYALALQKTGTGAEVKANSPQAQRARTLQRWIDQQTQDEGAPPDVDLGDAGGSGGSGDSPAADSIQPTGGPPGLF